MTKPRPRFLTGLALLLLLAAAASAAVIRLKVTAEMANIRLKPSISSAIIRQVKEGAVIEATRKEGEFYLVKLDPDELGRTAGYVHESLVLALDESAPAGKVERIVERAEPLRPKPIDELPPARVETPPPARVEPRQVEARPVTETAPAAEIPGRPAVIFYAGAVYSAIGDLNSGAQGLADLYAYQIGVPADKAADPLHFTLHYGGEFIFPLAKQFYLSAGLEYYGGTAQSLLSFTQGLGTTTLKVTPEFRAIPIKVAFLFYPSEYLYFKIGATYAFARAAYAYRFDQGTFWQDWSGEATAGALGFFGAVGLDLKVSNTFAVILEAAAQSLSVSGLGGTGVFQTSTMSASVTETGKLYSYDGQPTPFNSFPLLFLRNTTPTEGGVANARQAVLDLSGFSLKAGFKLTF